MAYRHFIKIERDEDRDRVQVVHLYPPRMLVEFQPVRDAAGKVVSVVIKRLCVPNSWTGDYHQCNRIVREAESFYLDSVGAGPRASGRF